MEKCPKCQKDDLAEQLSCIEEDCPYAQTQPDFQAREIDDGDLLTVPDEEPPEDLFFDEPKKLSLVPTEIRITSGKIITLNEQQREALELIFEWMDNKSDLFFRLSGYAGTGKTTLVKEALKRWKNRGNHAVVVSAPTHKAKKVIADATGMQGQTLQSLLGLRPDVELADFNVNKPEFAPKKKAMIEGFKLLVLDEGSMVNKALWEMVKKQAKRYNVKVLTMLDEAQLPPVKEEVPAIMVDSEVVYTYQLTKVERQAEGNPLMKIYDNIRNNLTAKTDQYHKMDEIIKEHFMDVDDSNFGLVRELGIKFTPDLRSFGMDIINAYRSEEFHQDKNHCKVLCWSNARVQFWNKSVRMTLLHDYEHHSAENQLHYKVIMPDELLMGYKSYTQGIENSGEYEVAHWQYDTRVVEYDKKWKNGKMDFKTVELNGYRIALRDVDVNTMINVFILEPDEEQEAKFTVVFNDLLWKAKTEGAWSAYYAFKAEYLLLRNITDNRGTLVCTKDLDYAYAITTHKAQGSTYDQVFIDEADMNHNKNHVERNKLKYVALSRPRYLATVLTGG